MKQQIHRGENTTVKDILYPQKQNQNKIWHLKNLKSIKEQTEKNRIHKQEQENYIPRMNIYMYNIII
jgi:glucose-6-phosphate isomerase